MSKNVKGEIEVLVHAYAQIGGFQSWTLPWTYITKQFFSNDILADDYWLCIDHQVWSQKDQLFRSGKNSHVFGHH